MEEQEIILDASEDQMNLVPASNGKRFANYIVDAICFYVVYAAFLAVVGFESAMQGPGQLMIYVIMFLYYIATEFGLKGKSIGKYITKTRVVRNEDGQPPSVGQVLGRTISRFVPFEALSIFFGGDRIMWHDKWPNTMVIDENESVLDDIV